MNERWIEVVVSRLLSLENPFLVHIVMKHMNKRLACKVIDAMELEALQILDRVGNIVNG